MWDNIQITYYYYAEFLSLPPPPKQYPAAFETKLINCCGEETLYNLAE
jgi:hypothetical protein